MRRGQYSAPFGCDGVRGKISAPTRNIKYAPVKGGANARAIHCWPVSYSRNALLRVAYRGVSLAIGCAVERNASPEAKSQLTETNIRTEL